MEKHKKTEWNKVEVSHIGQLIEMKKNIITKRQLSKELGLTENGLAYSLHHGTLKFKAFQRICELIEVSPVELFREGIDFYKRQHFDEMYKRKTKESSEQEQEINKLREEVQQLVSVNENLIKAVRRLGE